MDIMFDIRVYGVADKYDVPQLRKHACDIFTVRTLDLFDIIDGLNITIIREGLEGIIRKIY